MLDGLARDDLFTVVFDQVLTDTAVYADVVLPATTFLEHYDFAKGYGSMTLQLARPVIEPVGESRANADVFLDLAPAARARRATAIRPTSSSRCSASLAGLPPGDRRASCASTATATPPFDGRPVQFVDVFPQTPDGKVASLPEPTSTREAPLGLYGFQPDPATEQLPAGAHLTGERAHRQLHAGRARPAATWSSRCTLEDAGPRTSRTATMCGCSTARARCSCGRGSRRWCGPGRSSMPKGVWRRHTGNGLTSNALVPDTLTDLGGGACFNDARVNIMKVD